MMSDDSQTTVPQPATVAAAVVTPPTPKPSPMMPLTPKPAPTLDSVRAAIAALPRQTHGLIGSGLAESQMVADPSGEWVKLADVLALFSR